MTSSRMLMIVLIAAVVCVTVVGMGGAVPVEGWNKTFGGSNLDRGYSVQQTADGGYILAGETRSYGDINGDAWLIKTDGDGKEQWNKTFGRIYNDCANSVQQTSDGGYIIAGSSTSSDFYNDALLINTDANGNEKWNKTFSRGYQYDDGALSVQQTSDGGYVFAGRTRYYVEYPNDLIRDVWLVKTDANGKEQWNKTFEGSTGNYVQQTTDGGYIIAGGTDRYNAQLIKTDSNGQKQWNKTFEGSTAYSGQQTTDGGYIIVGGGGGAWLIKTDSNGQKQFNVTFERRTNYEEVALSVGETTDGGYVLVGYLYDDTSLLNDGWIIKADINGNEQWNKTFVNTEYINSVQQTKDGNYILAGSGVGIGVDAWLIKVSSDAETMTPVYNINTGTNYTTIQAAIDDASPGDEIHVDSGTYYENVNVNKQLILQGVDTGEGMPVVDAGLVGSAITLNADGSTLEGFTATNATSYPYAGIKVISSNNTLSNNTASNNSHNGIYLISSSNNMLSSNAASNNSNSGIVLYVSSNNNTLSGNTALNNFNPGIHLYSSCNNTLIGNIASNTRTGIYLYSSSNNTLIGNTVSNQYYGIVLLPSSNNNTILGNTASDNDYYGIWLNSSSSNSLYHNNLVDNTNYNAYDYNGSNQWDSGTEGNYYGDDYTGTDSDGDGIGDTPYPIPGGSSVDRYPLMAPYSPTGYSVGQGAPDLATKNHFIDAYNRNGGATVLGSPATEVHRAWGYLVQDFPGASGYAGGIIMYNPYNNYAYYIHGAIWERYYGLGGPRAKIDIKFELGPPTNDIKPYIHTEPPEVSSHGTQFRYQHFEGGALNHNIDTGEVFEIHGAIFAKWGELGYASDELGLVTSDEREAAFSPIGTEGRVSDFEGGHIHWHRTGGHGGESYETHGAIDAVYCAEGGSGDDLGFPVSDEYANPSGYPQSDFEGGYITTTDGVNYYVYMNDDTEGPVLEITSPEDGFHTDEYRIDISGTASDDSGILYDKVGIASSGFEATPTTSKCDPITHEWNTNIPLVYGINIIRVITWDKKHNPTEKTISVYCDPTDFRFVQITDVHIGCDPKSIIDPLSPLTDKAAKEVEESTKRFAETLKVIGNLNPKPTVLLITGDLVEWNDESFLSAFKAISDSYIFQEKMAGHDISVYYIPGNHDRRKLNPLDDDDLGNYHKYISASDNYCFSQGGYRFIGLDSGKDYNASVSIVPLTYDHSPESYGLSQGQIDFLQQEPKNTPKIIFMHHPAIEEIGNNDVKSVESVSEDPVPPNGPGGNDGCIAFKRPEFIDYCKEYNVQLVLTGHTHVDKFLDADGNPVRVYTNGYYGDVKPLFVQTRNVTKDTQGYLVVDAKDDAMRLFSPSGDYIPPSMYLCSITGPVNIHTYDSQDRHTGYGSVDVNIPESFYTGNYNGTAPDMPQMILLYNTTEEYRFEIVANLTEEEKTSAKIESFNFTVEQQTDDTRTIVTHLSVPLTENTTATLLINLTTTAYTMEIDYDSDGATDETKDPDSIETNYAPTAAIIAPETGLIYNESEPVEFNGTCRDPEDGILTNFSLVWYSDINGAIGAGERFSTANLSCGAHRITLMVNDSTGLMSTQSIALTITNDWMPGDLNHDGTLAPADAAIALRIAATGAHDDAADVSGDGCVTSLDALMILRAAAGAITI